ncbi:hypothetical protein IDSA_03405 [Pseudidiomarina salinarum]|uniref:2-C-methyl-D-erythritol 4-phosphate cytidylyltransferase n=1 Tax=Pseudidiomarina salinarum TaxID=435908 RepID=A0A094IX92_9GAMM|nr:2-C-methyl-D-erythritol 4-phosphate cytidylyltransferase [Pseudidiomarina salinarum]KFZ31747.1 hypothetical protein IDSA_03405 [Pseudidiomarina salinarum]RUO70481.1 2-C-methyl-D-erythritol 4-phosphate cytidylyltransferase [Pseudidiomarina salinarum]
MPANFSVAAVIPAAGIGSRMRTSMPKQYLRILDRTVLEHSLRAVASDPRVQCIYVAVAEHDKWFEQLQPELAIPLIRVTGGNSRAASVLAGVTAAVADGFQHVLVHDAARPCLSAGELAAVLDAGLTESAGAILALPVADTMKRGDAAQRISCSVARESLWHALTPQVFPARVLADGIRQLGTDNPALTDEASVFELLGKQPLLVAGKRTNIKITQPGDEQIAAAFLSLILQEQQCE